MNDKEQIEKTSGEILKKSIDDLKKIKYMSDLLEWVKKYFNKLSFRCNK